MKLGARILKTGIAIMLSLLISDLLNLPSPVFAGIAAIFAVQPTIYRSYLSIIEQIQGNLIGAIIASVFVLLLGNDVIIIGIAAVIVIVINLKLKIENTIALSLVTLIAIMEAPGENFIEFALIRFSTIILGVISAFIVNLVFLPPKYETKLFYKVTNVTEEIMKWIRLTTRHATEHTLLKNDIGKMKEELIKLEQLYLMFKEERSYFKKENLSKSRKLVVFRQMISTSKRSFEVLKRIHQYENEFHHMPSSFQNAIQHQLECLLNHHEELLLKFIGKIKTNVSTDDMSEYCLNQKGIFDLFLEQQKQLEGKNDQMLYHMMQFTSAIIEYGEHLEHLDKLITSFLNYHKDDNQVTITKDEE